MPNLKRDENYRLYLYLQGLSDEESAERLGLNRKTITSWRSRRGLPPNKGYNRRKAELFRVLDVVTQYSGWVTSRDIAGEVGMTVKQVMYRLRWLYEMGVLERRERVLGSGTYEYRSKIPYACCKYYPYSKDVNDRYCVTCGTFWRRKRDEGR